MWGGLAVAVAMDLERHLYKQIEPLVSDSLFPKNSRWSMLKIHEGESALHTDNKNTLHNDKSIANDSHLTVIVNSNHSV